MRRVAIVSAAVLAIACGTVHATDLTFQYTQSGLTKPELGQIRRESWAAWQAYVATHPEVRPRKECISVVSGRNYTLCETSAVDATDWQSAFLIYDSDAVPGIRLRCISIPTQEPKRRCLSINDGIEFVQTLRNGGWGQ